MAGRGGKGASPRMYSACKRFAGRAWEAPRALPLTTALLLLLTAAACGSGLPAAPAGDPTAGPTPPPASVTPPAPDPPLRSLAEFDFEAPAFVATLIARAGGGEVHRERVHLEDLTTDGREEAVVVVESGGTAGDIGVAVYRLLEGAPELLFFQRLAGHVEVRLGLVVIQEGVYAEGEAQCCPSRLREFAYGWRDGEFTLVSQQVVENPRR